MRIKKVLFWLFIFLLPTQLGRHFWPQFAFVSGVRIDYLSPTLFLTDILIFLLLFLFLLKGRWKKVRFSWFLIFVILYLSAVSFFAPAPVVSFSKLFRILEFCFLGIYLYKTKPFSQIVWPLSLSLLLQAILGWLQFLKGSSIGGFFWWLGERGLSLNSVNTALGSFDGRVFLRPYGTFSHPNSLAGFILVSLFLILEGKLPKKWKVFICFLSLSLLFLTFSEGTWLALGLTLLLLFMRRYWQKPNFLPLVFLIFFLVSILIVLSPPFFQDSTAILERKALLKIAFQILAENPFFGVGLSGFVPSLPGVWQGKLLLLQPVHNIFLLTACEIGIIGLVFFLWFWVQLLTKSLKSKFLFLATSSIFFTGLFDHYWLTLQQNQLLFVLLAARVWSLPKKE